MTDLEFVLSVLTDGELHTHAEILRRSFDERGHGLTVHSRVSQLRTERHCVIEHVTIQGASRGHASAYRLLSSPLEEPSASSGAGAGGSSSGAKVKARFVPIRAAANVLIGDGAQYSCVARRAPRGACAWIGAGADLLLTPRPDPAAVSGSAPAPVSSFFDEAPPR